MVAQWLTDHCKPYYVAFYQNDPRAAAAALERADTTLRQSNIEQPWRMMLQDKLRYLEYHLHRHLSPPTVLSGMLDDLLTTYATRAEFPLATSMRKALTLQLRVITERDGGRPYPPVEFYADFAGVVPGLWSSEVDYYVATWAYRHNDSLLVEQVLGRFTVQPGPMFGDFIWQHVNLMHQLQRGTATTRDVEELVRRLDNPRLWQAIEETVWPDCVRLSLVDGRIAGLLATRLKSFERRIPPLRFRPA